MISDKYYKRSVHRLTGLIISMGLLAFLASHGRAAEVGFDFGDREEDIGGPKITLKGEIEKGDCNKVIAYSAVFSILNSGLTISLDTPGGDVIEAMQIGWFCRETFAKVLIEQGNRCYSAGVLVLVGAPERQMFFSFTHENDGYLPSIGLHRPRFTDGNFGETDGIEARDKYEALSDLVRAYLKNMGAPEDFIERMFRASSEELDFVPDVALRDLSYRFPERIADDISFVKTIQEYLVGREPFLEEWLLSACPDRLADSEFDDWIKALEEAELPLAERTMSQGYVDYLKKKMDANYECVQSKLVEHQTERVRELVSEFGDYDELVDGFRGALEDMGRLPVDTNIDE